LSPYRDLTAAKHFLQLALWQTGQVRPRVINVDGHPAYARAISDLRDSGELSSRCRCACTRSGVEVPVLSTAPDWPATSGVDSKIESQGSERLRGWFEQFGVSDYYFRDLTVCVDTVCRT
jgi:hypothetical protein